MNANKRQFKTIKLVFLQRDGHLIAFKENVPLSEFNIPQNFSLVGK